MAEAAPAEGTAAAGTPTRRLDAAEKKRDLLDALHAGRTEWEALLGRVSPERMSEPALEGGWSVKDVVAHVETYERWMAMLLNAGGPNIPHEVDTMTQDERNAWIYEQGRGRSAEDVLQGERAAFRELVAAVESLPPEDLIATDKFEWAGSKPAYELVPWEAYLHYRDHMPAICALLDG